MKWVVMPASFSRRKTLAVVIVLQRDFPLISLRRAPSPAVILVFTLDIDLLIVAWIGIYLFGLALCLAEDQRRDYFQILVAIHSPHS